VLQGEIWWRSVSWRIEEGGGDLGEKRENKKQVVRILSGSNWLRIGSNGGVQLLNYTGLL
jgi:hypothetical protein